LVCHCDPFPLPVSEADIFNNSALRADRNGFFQKLYWRLNKMRVAIATDEGYVAQHFGKCSLYTIYDVDDRKINRKEIVENPGHEPGFLPKFLSNKGVQFVIAGGMGPKAIGFFNDFGIKTLVGVTGKVEDVINEFIKGTLKGGQSQCDHPHETKHHKCKHD